MGCTQGKVSQNTRAKGQITSHSSEVKDGDNPVVIENQHKPGDEPIIQQPENDPSSKNDEKTTELGIS